MSAKKLPVKNLEFNNQQFLRLIQKTKSTIKKALSPDNRFPFTERVNKSKQNRQSQQSRQKAPYNFNIGNQKSVNPELLLNRPQQAAILRDLMQMPKELKDLLALLMAQNQKLPPEQVKQFLEKNSKEVITKLIRLIQQTPTNQQNHEQMKQLIGLLNQIIPARESTQQEMITQLLLLYLPWLPLQEHQKIEVAFEKKESGEEADDSVALVIYISTINLGRFKVVIYVLKNQNMNIIIQNIEGQEKEVLKSILKEIKSGIKDENITAVTNMTVTTQQNFEKSEERKITISQVNNLSPMVLVAAQKIAQIIFEHDEKVSLLEKREEKIKE